MFFSRDVSACHMLMQRMICRNFIKSTIRFGFTNCQVISFAPSQSQTMSERPWGSTLGWRLLHQCVSATVELWLKKSGRDQAMEGIAADPRPGKPCQKHGKIGWRIKDNGWTMINQQEEWNIFLFKETLAAWFLAKNNEGWRGGDHDVN